MKRKMNLIESIKKGYISGFFFFMPLISHAQRYSYLPDFNETENKYVASQSSNAAFLSIFPLQRVSYLETSVTKSNGDFVNYNQSDNSYQIGLKTESYYRFNDRIMLYGTMGYGQEEGKKMAGSSFIPGNEGPFDMVEMNDSCVGDKKLQVYSLGGALSYKLSKKFILGGNVFYQTSNYAKFKDLRHQNSRMDMKIGVGLNYSPIDYLTFGLSYIYNRQNESIGFDVYGNTELQYYTLIDYGAFFGRKEAFGESGYTSETTPLFTQSHGGAFQVLYQPTEGVKWFNEVYYHKLDGRFGSGDDRTVVYSTHNGNHWGYEGKVCLGQKENTHVLSLSLDQISTSNFENSYREATDENAVTQIIYYGKNKMLERNHWNGILSYTYYHNITPQLAQYYTGVRLGFDQIHSKTIYYPFYRKQKINSWNADWYGTYHWMKNKNVFTLSLMAGYASGGGTMKNDGTFDVATEENKKPVSRDDLLLKHYDYLTASRIHGEFAFGYERMVKKNISAYAKASISPRYALNSTFKNMSHIKFGLQLGVKF